MATQIFYKVPSLQVIICRQYQYGVWPGEVLRHLKRQHYLDHSVILAITQEVQQWDEIAQDSQSVQIPPALDDPLPIIPCYSNGLLCRRDPAACEYVAASIESMRKHWRTNHHWSRYRDRGRITIAQRLQHQIEIQSTFQTVSYQQLFPSRRGSHFILIRYPNGRRSPPPDRERAQQAVDTVLGAWEQSERDRLNEPIQPDLITDANSWLRFTQWAVFLQGIAPLDLLQSVASPENTADGSLSPNHPNRSPDPGSDETPLVEIGVCTLRETVAQLARKCQRTVQHASASIRLEAVRTQTKELPYHPLLAYMDEESILRHVFPWQQILTFFARTQAPHDWESPKYGFTHRQRVRWSQLWDAVIHLEEEPAGFEVDPDLAPWLISKAERLCLEFCVELLNQRFRSHEYESALIYAMAVLGRGEEGWRTADSYPPILSKVIKIARFFVVQKALWLDPAAPEIVDGWRTKQTAVSWALLSADDTLGDLDEGYASSVVSTPSRRQGPLFSSPIRPPVTPSRLPSTPSHLLGTPTSSLTPT